MNRRELMELLETSPVVAAIKDEAGIDACLRSDCQVVFILFGNLMNIADIVARIKQSGRVAFVHLDLIEGMASREIAADFIAQKTQADGVISTKQPVIRRAAALGLLTVQRFFLLDSMALEAIRRQIGQSNPDLVEVLPGIMPKVIRRLCDELKPPLIAGGLMQDKEDIMAALDAGAIGISATRSEIWFM